jgi:hypothetical protein
MSSNATKRKSTSSKSWDGPGRQFKRNNAFQAALKKVLFLLLQQLEHGLLRRVGLGQNGGGSLLHDLRAGQLC